MHPKAPLHSDQWQEIEGLFNTVLNLPEVDRNAYLDEACQGKPQLRAQMDQLLQAHKQTDGFLDRLEATQVSKLIGYDEERPAGFRVGPYRILNELGRGGMGVVYLAERDDGQFDQQVALKLIKQNPDANAGVDRFLKERQILARLQHPNIAHLLDGGITTHGQPYFAMEYVEGVPITHYCDAHKLPIKARLHIFMKVIEGDKLCPPQLGCPSRLKALEYPGPHPKGPCPGQAPRFWYCKTN